MIKQDLKPLITLFKAHQSMVEFIKKDIKDTSFDLNEFSVFEVIYHYQHIKVQDIKEKDLVANSSLTYILDKLVKKGLIKRIKCHQDQRVTYIGLTDEGQQVANQIFPSHYERMQQLLDVLTLNEQHQLTILLKKIGIHTKEQL